MSFFTKNSKDTLNIEGSVRWQAPSNIALVKYWGKHGDQLPCNPSISLTLNNSHTITTLKWHRSSSRLSEVSLELFFHGKKEKSFQKRMEKFFNKLAKTEMPFLLDYKLCLETENSFPHSAGIASSASAMASVALCLCDMENIVSNHNLDTIHFMDRASHLARLGSGSAGRSVYPFVAWWGEEESVKGAKDLKAVEIEDIHDVFKTFQDSIIIVSSDKKSVSSSVGHQLMENNEMAPVRFKKARANCLQSLVYLKEGNISALGEIIEQEALELHALMMTSKPSFILMKPGTLAIIEKVRKFREEKKVPLYFTLDAGPNVHLLYPEEYKNLVVTFIEEEVLELAEDRKVIHDVVGKGPVKLV